MRPIGHLTVSPGSSRITIERLFVLQGGHNLFSGIASSSQYGFRAALSNDLTAPGHRPIEAAEEQSQQTLLLACPLRVPSPRTAVDGLFGLRDDALDQSPDFAQVTQPPGTSDRLSCPRSKTVLKRSDVIRAGLTSASLPA